MCNHTGDLLLKKKSGEVFRKKRKLQFAYRKMRGLCHGEKGHKYGVRGGERSLQENSKRKPEGWRREWPGEAATVISEMNLAESQQD